MRLEEFKAQNNVSTLNFYKSKESDRHVASHGDLMLITTAEFAVDKPAFVYMADDEYQEGTETVYWVSNKEPKKAAFVL